MNGRAMQAAIFPGQGAQLVGMGADVAQEHEQAAAVFENANDVLGVDLRTLCFEGPAEKLNQTDIQQPAIFVTSVAIYRAALASGLFTEDQFDAMGGLSLGEYTALHLAGALPFADALRLVHRRGQLMQACCDQYPGTLVSLMGLDEPKVLALCEAVRDKGIVGPANFNCPGQIVISGDIAACEAAAAKADEFGGRAIPLRVAGAFHSELMRDAAEGLKETLAAAEISTPRINVTANTTGDYHRDAESIRDALYAQVVSPVRWQACVERMIADGVDAFWEVGPNRVLTGLMRKIDRKMNTKNVSKASDLQPAAA